ncbi:hypothetical protein AgCh_018947 [Apium graveolens]
MYGPSINRISQPEASQEPPQERQPWIKEIHVIVNLENEEVKGDNKEHEIFEQTGKKVASVASKIRPSSCALFVLGLVAASMVARLFEYCDIVTKTTHKELLEFVDCLKSSSVDKVLYWGKHQRLDLVMKCTRY